MGRRTGSYRAQYIPDSRRLCVLLLFLCTALFLSACSKNSTTAAAAAVSENEDINTPSEKDLRASGTAVVLKVRRDVQKIVLEAVDTGEQYELSYDGKTYFYDEYDAVMVPEELAAGDIVDIVVSIHSGVLTEVRGTKGTFRHAELTEYDINLNKGVFSFDGRNFRITDSTIVVENGEPGRFSDIKRSDILTIRGIGHDIYSITVSSGAGFVRIRGAESFQGGWIEIGEMIQPVEENMLLTVPEGNYDMMVSYHKYGGSKKVNVVRGKEVTVDVSDLKGELLKYGKITFTFTPASASPTVRIDGEKILTSTATELEYGVHSMDIFADGYVTIHKYISVGSPLANLDVQLEEVQESSTESSESTEEHKAQPDSSVLPDKFTKKDDSEEASEEEKEAENTQTAANTNTAASNAQTTAPAPEEPASVSSATNQLYIDSPEGVEVYFDGSYKGIAPCHFTKTAGTHVVTLMKTGYATKNYTITLAATTDNESYSFNELKKEKKREDNVQSVSN